MNKTIFNIEAISIILISHGNAQNKSGNPEDNLPPYI